MKRVQELVAEGVPQGLNRLRKNRTARTKTVPPRLKPDSFCGVCGTTKIVPSQKNRGFPRSCKDPGFFAVCGTTEVVPRYKAHSVCGTTDVVACYRSCRSSSRFRRSQKRDMGHSRFHKGAEVVRCYEAHSSDCAFGGTGFGARWVGNDEFHGLLPHCWGHSKCSYRRTAQTGKCRGA